MSTAKYIDDINNIIDKHENLVMYDYKGNENQILIQKELAEKIIHYVKHIEEKIDLKEFLKLSIRKCFELSEKDIVLGKNGHIFIKIVQKIKKVHVPQEKKNTALNRFNGIDEDEIKSFYEEFFSEEENKYFFPTVAKEFAQIYFHEQKITNDIFEKNVFGYIHNLTFEHLTNKYDENDDEFFKGFAGYLFRLHFKEVFEYIADLILGEIAIGNSHLVEFLKYYSSDTIVIGGEKYKVPAIEAQDGLRWNALSMLSTAKIYTKTEKSILLLKEKIVELDERIDELYVNGLSPIAYQEAFEKKKKSLEEKIESINKKLEKLYDSLELAKDDDQHKTLELEIETIQKTLREIRKEKSDLSKKKISLSVLRRYNELQANKDSTERQLSNDRRVLSQNEETYTSIRSSLVKALTSKKKKL